MKAKCLKYFFTLFSFTFLAFNSQSALAKLIFQDESSIGNKHYSYVYEWSNPTIKTKAIVLAIHGLTMHGKVYNGLAQHLAEEGFLVYAPDLPGYGRRWQTDNNSFLKAQENILDIVQQIKSTYPNLPLICLGESLGANLAIGAAKNKPNCIDGIILSNPALKTRVHLAPKTIAGRANMVLALFNSEATVDLSPYVRAYASEDPNITQEILNDPLVHKQLKCVDIWEAYQNMRPIFKQASQLSKSTPILIMQGKKDKILDAKAIINLVSNLNSDDQTVKWFANRGHTILEVNQPKLDVLDTIDNWFISHSYTDKSDNKNISAITEVKYSLPGQFSPQIENVISINNSN